ncbi:PREDICTED: protein trichome birefringence-like 38 [Ipomoea nil]|uniref:protein trichome birefringence-like 38 n=1 Tax=Ipomoea nil TaxID=35883 RepID=UPI00090137CD|nr:PREDICTED: protein trichome birefringence-like 38 [Ipomoea nil]
MGERVWNSVFIVFLLSLLFAYFCSKSLTPFYWIEEEGSHENIHHLEMQAVCNNGNGGGNSSSSIAKKTKSNSQCNWFQGTWVFDDSYPLYDSMLCPFIRKVFHCIKFGRPDREYLKYRWQPHGCELPKFDGRDFLSRMRGKKIMYIGDSLSLNNFESLLCLLHATVPGVKYREEFTALNVTVTFLEYEVEVILFHSEFLIDIENRVAKMNSIKSGEIWKQMDVLIFNSGLWWMRRGTKQPWDFIEQVDGQVVKDMSRFRAYQMALQSWAKWVEGEVDHTKTKVFYQSEAASHYIGAEWGKPTVTNCENETMLLNETTISTEPSPLTKITRNIVRQMPNHVYLLDIWMLTRYRLDGHPAGYNIFKGDCTHWCLAGVPDTWNLILNAALLQHYYS